MFFPYKIIHKKITVGCSLFVRITIKRGMRTFSIVINKQREQQFLFLYASDLRE